MYVCMYIYIYILLYIHIFIWAPESTFYSAALFVFLSVFASSNCFMLGLGWLGGVGWGNNAVAKITRCHKNFFIAFPHPLHATLYTFDGDTSYRLGWGWLGWVGWGNNVLALAYPLAVTSYTFLLATSEEVL